MLWIIILFSSFAYAFQSPSARFPYNSQFDDVIVNYPATVSNVVIDNDDFIRGNGSANWTTINDYINYGDIQDLQSSFTVNYWFKDGCRQVLTKHSNALPTRWDFGCSNNNVQYTRGGGAITITGSIPIDINSWTMITMRRNNSQLYLYVNGTLDSEGTESLDLSGNTAPLRFNCFGNSACEVSTNFNGSIDDLRIWNDTALEDDEILNLFLSDVAITFKPPTLPSGTTNDTADANIINISCENDNEVTLYFDDNPNPIGKVINEETSPAYFITNVTIEGIYFYKASCDNGVTNSSIRNWTFDATSPTITINPNNFFTENNLSTQNPYNNQVIPNITLTDNIELFGFEINITRNGDTFFNFSNESISGLTFNYITPIDITLFPKGTYNISILGSDSHTANKINKYDVIKKNKEIIFNTNEGNRISIVSDLPSTTDYSKAVDRYSFEFNFGATLEQKKVFTLTSDKKIYYRKDSPYSAHFVIWNPLTKSGNWLDFEGYKNAQVTKITDYRYTITFNSLPNKPKFNSIGGLNVNQRNFTWYRGESIVTSPLTLGGFPAEIKLNLSIDNTVSDIFANLTFNNTEQEATKQTFSEFILFTRTVTAPLVIANETNIEVIWNVTFIQTDGSTINFSINGNLTVQNWDLDNCTLYSTEMFTIFTMDEIANVPLTTNSTFLFTFNVQGETTHRQKGFTIYNRNNYTFCKFPTNVTLESDMIHTFTANGYEQLNFNRFNEILNHNFTAYLLQTSTQASTILYTLVDSSLSKVEDAIMSFYRRIGDELTLVGQHSSDFAGQVSLVQDQTYEYFINISHPNFPLKQFNLKPVLTTYTIKLLGTGETLYNNIYEGISYQVRPPDNLFEVGQWLNLTFEVRGDDLELFGINFTRHDFTCIPASCNNISTSITGGNVTVKINLNQTGRFYTSLYFKRIGGPFVHVNLWPNDATIFQTATRSLVQMFAEIKEETSPNVRAVIVAVCQAIAIGTASAIGIAGWPLVVISSFVILFFSFPTIGFINPLFGSLMVFTGLIMYVFISRNG